jgi:uncharacterized membrane protein
MTTNQAEGHQMQAIQKHLKEVYLTISAFVSFLRALVAKRMSLIMGDERGEIASWVVVTALVVVAAIVIVGIVVVKLTSTANNIQTP